MLMTESGLPPEEVCAILLSPVPAINCPLALH